MPMKYLLSLIFLFLCASAPAQTVQVDRNTGRLYMQPYNGSLVQQMEPTGEKTRGTPFLYDTACPAVLFIDNSQFDFDETIVDLDQEIIILQLKTGNQYLSLTKLDSAELCSSMYRYDSQLGFVELIYHEKEYTLLKLTRIKLKKADYKPQFDQGTRYDEYVKSVSLNIEKEGRSHSFNKISDLSSFLTKEEYAGVRKYVKQTGIGKKPNQEETIQILRFLNSL